MTKVNENDLQDILESHKEWVYTKGKSGKPANLRWEDLSKVKLPGVELSGSYLEGTRLRWADLRGANFKSVLLRGADLRGADLSGANLSDSNLIEANLSGADLRDADLRGARFIGANLSDLYLWGADLRGALLPSPTVLLLCHWGTCPDGLTTELMRYDAANHPDPDRFDEWANGGSCPYDDVLWDRAARFIQNPRLWSPGPAKSALWLVERLFEEKGIKR